MGGGIEEGGAILPDRQGGEEDTVGVSEIGSDLICSLVSPSLFAERFHSNFFFFLKDVPVTSPQTASLSMSNDYLCQKQAKELSGPKREIRYTLNWNRMMLCPYTPK